MSRFILCFESHAEDGKVWAIRTKGKWIRVTHVLCGVPVETVYRGSNARQPKAYLVGEGHVIVGKERAVIL